MPVRYESLAFLLATVPQVGWAEYEISWLKGIYNDSFVRYSKENGPNKPSGADREEDNALGY